MEKQGVFISSIIFLDPYKDPLEIHRGNLVWDFSGKLIRSLLLNPESSEK